MRTPDELVQAAKALLDEAHEAVNALEPSPMRRIVRRKLTAIHLLCEEVNEELVGNGVVQPLSGGTPKDTE